MHPLAAAMHSGRTQPLRKRRAPATDRSGGSSEWPQAADTAWL